MRRDPTSLHDDSIMPWGKYRDHKLIDVPDDYWLWFLKQGWCDQHPQLVEYANHCVPGFNEGGFPS